MEIAPPHGALDAAFANALIGVQCAQASRHLAALGIALRIAGFFARLGEGIARRGFVSLFGFGHRHQRQQQRLPHGCVHGSALLGVDGIVAARPRLQEHGIDPLQHGRRVATRAIGTQHGRIEFCNQHFARSVEQPGIGAPEPVDRLLRIAHEEHAWLRASAGITGQPALQDAPLHRIRILKLVEQQMLVARVEPHLQVSGRIVLLHQARRFPFEIGEIHRARLALVRLIAVDECIAQRKQCSVDGAHAGLLATRLKRRQSFAKRGMQGHQRLRVLVADGFDERLGRLASACFAGLRVERGEQRFKRLRASSLVRHIHAARSSDRRFDGHRALAFGRTALP